MRPRRLSRGITLLPREFPFVLSTDSAAKSIGAKPGDFVKITRASETAGETVYYRYVVEA